MITSVLNEGRLDARARDRMAALTADGLTRRFGDLVAVDGLTFEIPSGGVVGFVGPNGSGKSTTIRMLLGLIAPFERATPSSARTGRSEGTFIRIPWSGIFQKPNKALGHAWFCIVELRFCASRDPTMPRDGTGTWRIGLAMRVSTARRARQSAMSQSTVKPSRRTRSATMSGRSTRAQLWARRAAVANNATLTEVAGLVRER